MSANNITSRKPLRVLFGRLFILSSFGFSSAFDVDCSAKPAQLQPYCFAGKYVEHRNASLSKIYFPDANPANPYQFKYVDHLIVGRGVASLNLFSARYTRVMERGHEADNPYKCDEKHQRLSQREEDLKTRNDSTVLMVGDEDTGLWNNSTLTLAQTLKALNFPYLPYNPIDFVSFARTKRDEYVSSVNMHQALLASHCATRAPVLAAIVEDIQLAIKNVNDPRAEECSTKGNFLVTMKQVYKTPFHQKDNITPSSYLCVKEIDIASGRGVPRDLFHNRGKFAVKGVDSNATIKELRSPYSSGFGKAPAVITYRDFVLASIEDPMSVVAQVQEDGRVPTIIVDGGGGSSLSAVRRAMMGKDDISKNLVYSAPVDSSFAKTKNPQMALQMLRNNYTQNAKVVWVSRDDLDGSALRGENKVRMGSEYDIMHVYKSPSSDSIYGGFGSMYFYQDLCSIDVDSSPRVATFCPFRKDLKPTRSPDSNSCCNPASALNVSFDQFVTCTGEDDTIEKRELWDNKGFGNSEILRGSVRPSVDIPYAVGFKNTEGNLRIFGSAATNADLFPKDAIDTFSSEGQLYKNDGQVVPLQFSGNMLSMMLEIQVYATTVLNKRMARINLCMSTEQLLLRFLDEACVPCETSNEFIKYLRSINNEIQPIQQQNDFYWPLNPNGIDDEDLQEYIQKHKGLSKNVSVWRGRTLVSKNKKKPCSCNRGEKSLFSRK